MRERYQSVKTLRLGKYFRDTLTGVSMLTLASSYEAAAQDAQSEDVLIEQQAENLPYYLRFKPLALCQQAEADVTDAIRQRVLDDNAFGALEEWSDGEDAAQIMTYRLCREEDPAVMGDMVLIDALFI